MPKAELLRVILGSSSVSIPTQVREPAPACSVSVPLLHPARALTAISGSASLESGAWSLLPHCPVQPPQVGLKRCPPPRSRVHSWDAHLWHPSISPFCAEAPGVLPAVFCVCRSALRTSSLSPLPKRPLLCAPKARISALPDCLECES